IVPMLATGSAPELVESYRAGDGDVERLRRLSGRNIHLSLATSENVGGHAGALRSEHERHRAGQLDVVEGSAARGDERDPGLRCIVEGDERNAEDGAGRAPERLAGRRIAAAFGQRNEGGERVGSPDQ